MSVAVVDVGTVATATDTSISISSPDGSAGDYVVFFLFHDDYSDGPLSPSSPPITLATITDGDPMVADDSRQYVFGGFEDQASGRSYTFGTLGAAEEIKGVCVRFSGVDTTNPVGSGSSALVRDGGTRFPGGIEAARVGDMFVGLVTSDTGLTFSTPSGWAATVDSGQFGQSVFVGTMVADQYPFPQTLADLSVYEGFNVTGSTFVLQKDRTESYTLSGVTKDSEGSALGSCEVALFIEVSANVYQFVASTTSDPSTGAYSFTVYDDPANYMVMARKDDTADVFDVTDNNLQPS